MAQDANIYIYALISLYFVELGLLDVKELLLHIPVYNLIIREMKLNESPSFYGAEKAEKLGLTSSRFREKHMSHHAEEEMNIIKKKDRSDIEVNSIICS